MAHRLSQLGRLCHARDSIRGDDLHCLDNRTSATGRDGNHLWKVRPFSNRTCFAKVLGSWATVKGFSVGRAPDASHSLRVYIG